MGVLEDIKRMQEEGRSEQEIFDVLQAEGVPMTDISNAIAQTKIKQAITAPAVSEEQFQTQQAAARSPSQGMQPSLMIAETAQQSSASPEQEAEYPVQQQPQQQQYAEEEYAQAAQQAYAQYPQNAQYQQDYSAYSSATGSDTISEIAEQVFLEKMSPISKKIESLLDMKTFLDSKLAYLDERLKRLEKIIDRLEISILQKVGEYVTNVEDIKHELVETQKSFKSLLPKQSSLSSSDNKKGSE